MPQRQGHLDQARHARRGLEMAEVGLHRPDEARLAVGPAGTQRGADRRRFDRVADPRARAVRLDVLHLARRESGLAQRVFDHRLLRAWAGHRHAVRAAVLVDGRGANDGVNGIAIAPRRGQRLQHDHAGTFAAHVAVGIGVEGAAFAVGRQHRGLAEPDGQLGGEQDLDAARKRHLALTDAQALTREVHSGERRRTGRIHGHARAAQVVDIRQAVGGNAGGRAAVGVHVDIAAVRRVHLQVAVVVGGDAHEHAGARSGQRRRRHTSVFARLPHQFEQQAVLRIDVRRLARRDAEELRIEQIDAVEEAAPARVGAARLPRIGIETVGEAGAVSGRFRDGIDALFEQAPEGPRAVGAARKPAADADDRNLIVHPSSSQNASHP